MPYQRPDRVQALRLHHTVQQLVVAVQLVLVKPELRNLLQEQRFTLLRPSQRLQGKLLLGSGNSRRVAAPCK